MKISKSKQELARIISENGGWRDVAKFSVSTRSGTIVFSRSKPKYTSKYGFIASGGFIGHRIELCSYLKNWHQTILSREEYFHYKDGVKPTDSAKVDGQSKPTLDQLLQYWRNAEGYARRKQTEADEAATMRDERWREVQALAGEVGVTVGRCDPVVIGEQELVITDYHHLHIGDILRCKSVPSGAKCRVGDEGVLVRTESSTLAGGVFVDVCGRDWFGVFGEHWEFIHRP